MKRSIQPIALFILAGIVGGVVFAPVAIGSVSACGHFFAAGCRASSPATVDCAAPQAASKRLLVCEVDSDDGPSFAGVGASRASMAPSCGEIRLLSANGRCTSDTLLLMHVRLNQ